ncbi:MAG: ribonuclease III [Pseudomonadota bacterium]|nr:ribonuclease III [Pseudomonadota bacterium]
MTRKAARGGESPEGLAALERGLGHTFANPELARQGLTHRSFGAPHNERLEFLGDSLLNCAVATLLYERFPQLPEGDLSRLRAALVNQASLFEVAAKLGLGDRLRLGEGELKSGGFRRPSILADALEGLLGAVYLDAGFEAVRNSVERLLGERLESRDGLPVDKDPKTALQEHTQGRKLQLPRYSVQRTEGEAHDQTFTVECRVDDLGLVATGKGASRRAAEQAAAEGVLTQLEKPAGRKKT